MPDGASRDERALVALLAEVEARRVRLYRNALRQPWIYCDVPNHPSLHVQLFDRDFRGWFANFVWQENQEVIHEREIDRLLEILAGRSMNEHVGRVTDPALLQVIETEPLVA